MAKNEKCRNGADTERFGRKAGWKNAGIRPRQGKPYKKKAGGAPVRQGRNPASRIQKAETTEEFYADQFFHKRTDGVLLHFPDTV